MMFDPSFTAANCTFNTAEPATFNVGSCSKTTFTIQHRASCHRCGNMRKTVVKCTACPQVYCISCYDKMADENGTAAFYDGCPMCKRMCCCHNKVNQECNKMFHCYKKCRSHRKNTYTASFASKENDRLANLAEVCSLASKLDTAETFQNKAVNLQDDVCKFGEHTRASEQISSDIVAELRTPTVRPAKKKRRYVNMVSAAKKQRVEETSKEVAALAPMATSPFSPIHMTTPVSPPSSFVTQAPFPVTTGPVPVTTGPSSLELDMDEVYNTFSPASYVSPLSSYPYSPIHACATVTPSYFSLPHSPNFIPSPLSGCSSITPLIIPLQHHMHQQQYMNSLLPNCTIANPFFPHYLAACSDSSGVAGETGDFAGEGTAGNQAMYVQAEQPSFPYGIDFFSAEDPLIVRPNRQTLLPTCSPTSKAIPAANSMLKPDGNRTPPKPANTRTDCSPPLFSASNFRGLQVNSNTASSCSEGFPTSAAALTPTDLTSLVSLDSPLFADPHPSPTDHADLQELLSDFLAIDDMLEDNCAGCTPPRL